LLVFDIPNWNIKDPTALGRLYFANSSSRHATTLVDLLPWAKQMKIRHLLVDGRSFSL
jgi:hypothetical protein